MIKQQIQNYIDKVSKEISFEPSEHVYKRISDGYLLTGTTTVLDVRAKDFLKFWTAKEAVKYLGFFDEKETPKEEGMKRLMEELEKIRIMSYEDYFKLLIEAKGAAFRKAKTAANDGTEAHQWIEIYIKNKLAGRNRMEKLAKPKKATVLNAVKAFLEWEKANRVVWLASELRAWSPTLLTAGTIDFLAEVNGRFIVGDLKTSNQFSEDVLLQTAAYQNYLEEAGIKSQGRLAIRIPKDGKGFEAWNISSDYQFDLETFKHAREIHRWNVNCENNLKDDNKRLIIK